MSFAAYSEYKHSNVPWIGEVPSHWNVAPLKTRFRLKNGWPFAAEEFDSSGETGNRLVRIRDILGTDDLAYTDEPCPTEALLQDGDVLIGMDGDFNVKYWNEGPAKLNQRLCALRGPSEEWDRFLYYLLPAPLEIINDLTFSTTVKHLSSRDVRKIRIPIPTNKEVSRLVAFLDHETARIDALIEEQHRLINLLREKRQSATARLITQGLDNNASLKESGIEWIGHTPSHWAIGRVGWWFQVDLGKMLDESRITGDHLAPYIRNTDVQWDRINVSELPEMDFAPSERMRYRLEYGDLLVCEGGEIGRSAIWPYEDFECYYQKALHRVRSLGKGHPEFLLWILRYLAEGGILDGSATSSTINHLTRDQLRRLVIALPPREEQSEIVESLREAHEEFLRLEREAKTLIRTLGERRSALISAAATGKIDVREWDQSMPAKEQVLPQVAEKEGRYG